MESFSVFQLEDIYDENVADIFVIVMSVIGWIGIVSSITVFLIIFFKTPLFMKKFRFYLLCYVFCNLVAELVTLLYKPIYIPEFIVIYPRELLSPMNDTTSKLLFGILFTSGLGNLVIFLIILIERYAAMSINGPLSMKTFYKHPTFYIFSEWVIVCIVTISSFLSIFLIGVFYPAEETYVITKNYIIGGDKLLNFQSNLIRLNQRIFKSIAPFFIFVFFLHAVTLIIFFILCFRSIKNYSFKFAVKTLENNKMLLKSICFLFLTMLCFVILPLTALIIIMFLNLSSKYIFYYVVVMISTFAILDNIVIIMTITPYRKFIVGKLNWLKSPSTVLVSIK